MQRIFVGDVQGCADELEELLGRARREYGTAFEAWFVGDVVNRGPASLRALARVRELVEAGRGRMVLGNHELGLIAVAMGLRPPGPWDTAVEVLERPDGDAWVAWLRRRPLAVTGELAGRPFAMVHAAAAPSWSLEELEAAAAGAARRLADPDEQRARRFLKGGRAPRHRDVLARLTRCRSVRRDGRWSESPPSPPAEAWHAAWARERHDYGLVYGHWSLQGLHVAPGLRGLDTGCVHHGRGRDGFLTAWLPDERRADAFDVPDEGFWQVRGLRRYLPDRLASGPEGAPLNDR